MASKLVTAAYRLQAILSARTGPMTSSHLHRTLVNAGVDPMYKQDAAKLLRDCGIPVYATKGAYAEWQILSLSDTTEMAKWDRRVMRQFYSEQVSLTRSLSGATGAGSRKVRDVALRAAILIGGELGVDPASVLAECKPRSLPWVNGSTS
jgi:hypothetical protein